MVLLLTLYPHEYPMNIIICFGYIPICSVNHSLVNCIISSCLYVFTHRIHGAAIYGVPWIPSIYPSHVSINTTYIPYMVYNNMLKYIYIHHIYHM